MSAPEPSDPRPTTCPRCGAPLHEDQDWCLECGAPARTRLAPTPNWHIPAALLAVVVALAGAALAVAFVAADEGRPAGAGDHRRTRPRRGGRTAGRHDARGHELGRDDTADRHDLGPDDRDRAAAARDGPGSDDAADRDDPGRDDDEPDDAHDDDPVGGYRPLSAGQRATSRASASVASGCTGTSGAATAVAPPTTSSVSAKHRASESRS